MTETSFPHPQTENSGLPDEAFTERSLGRVLLVRGRCVLDGTGPDISHIVRDAQGARVVLLDATEVPYVNTGGIRWLLSLRNALEAAGKRLRLAATPSGRVWRILKLLDLGLEVYESPGRAWRVRDGDRSSKPH